MTTAIVARGYAAGEDRQATAAIVAAEEQPVFAADGKRLHGAFGQEAAGRPARFWQHSAGSC